MLAFMSACTEEKTFYIEDVKFGNVNFVIENMQIGEGSVAHSTMYDGYSYRPDGEGLTFEIYVNSALGGVEGGFYRYTLDGNNIVMSGGNNDLQLRFSPQCPEEVSAHFTMPWGKEYDLTAKDSVVNVLINRDFLAQSMNPDLQTRYYLVVKAESKYKKDNTTYVNSGYILIDIDQDLEYDKSDGKWYINDWMNNDLEIKGNCNFYARNLSVGEPDHASTTWDEGYGGYYPTGYRNDNFFLPIYHLNDDGTKTNTGHTLEFNLESKNLLWVGMNNEVQFTFRSSGTGEDNARLTLPDGNVIDFTRQDSTYVWAVPNDIVSTSGRNPVVVTAESEFARGGVKHFNKGYMLIEVNRDMYFDKSDGTWLWGQ